MPHSVDPYRPVYHFAPPTGWMNDPNGLIQWGGAYHLFYQHHPYSARWGPMHWGHAVSPDLVRWTHLPIALCPEPTSVPGDQSGIFSGSAVDDDGTLTLIYTQYTDPKAHPHATREVQCIATSRDGVAFAKSTANPVIPAPPPEATEGFRDPKVWRETDGRWKMLVGSGQAGQGLALLYESPDLRTWTYLGPLCEGDGSNGAMWECPDLFPLGDKHVLIFSVNEPPLKQATYYYVGTYANNRFTPEHFGDTDFGPDFYAAQTVVDAAGRRIMIGWMDSWGAPMPTEAQGWAGTMSLPRELFLLSGGGGLGIRPVRELENHRPAQLLNQTHVEVPAAHTPLAGVAGDSLEILAEFDLTSSDAAEFGLQVRRSPDGAEATTIAYHRTEARLTLDRSASGQGAGGAYSCTLAPGAATLRLQLFVDRSSVEVFAGDGQAAASAKVYPIRADSLGVALFARGGTARLNSLQVWTIA